MVLISDIILRFLLITTPFPQKPSHAVILRSYTNSQMHQIVETIKSQDSFRVAFETEKYWQEVQGGEMLPGY